MDDAPLGSLAALPGLAAAALPSAPLSAAASTTAPFAATETRHEAPVFDIWGADVDVVLDVGAEGDVTKLARSSFREYFAAAAPPPETGLETSDDGTR